MQASYEATEGLVQLKKIVTSFPPESSHWNEAENRFQFVDRLLVECLGWEQPNMRVEVTDDLGGRADYVLGHPAKAILEAKKEAKVFEALPVGKPSLVRKLRPLVELSKNLGEAVNQVVPYCAMQGAQVAILCNGPQLVIFQAVIPGVRRQIIWNTLRAELMEDLAHLVCHVRRRLCGDASAWFRSSFV